MNQSQNETIRTRKSRKTIVLICVIVCILIFLILMGLYFLSVYLNGSSPFPVQGRIDRGNFGHNQQGGIDFKTENYFWSNDDTKFYYKGSDSFYIYNVDNKLKTKINERDLPISYLKLKFVDNQDVEISSAQATKIVLTLVNRKNGQELKIYEINPDQRFIYSELVRSSKITFGVSTRSSQTRNFQTDFYTIDISGINLTKISSLTYQYTEGNQQFPELAEDSSLVWFNGERNSVVLFDVYDTTKKYNVLLKGESPGNVKVYKNFLIYSTKSPYELWRVDFSTMAQIMLKFEEPFPVVDPARNDYVANVVSPNLKYDAFFNLHNVSIDLSFTPPTELFILKIQN